MIHLTINGKAIEIAEGATILQAAKKFIFPDGEVLLVRGPAAVLRPVLSPLGTLRPIQSGQ